MGFEHHAGSTIIRKGFFLNLFTCLVSLFLVTFSEYSICVFDGRRGRCAWRLAGGKAEVK